MGYRVVCSGLLLLFISLVHAEPADDVDANWPQWVAALRVEALAEGIEPALFDSAFSGVQPSRRVQHLDRTQPEKRLTFIEYRNSRIDAYRILIGRREAQKHRALLKKIGAEFHVSPCVVTALWGMESSYGRVKGNFPVVAALATLAYEGRRKTFFRHELLLALKILNEHHVTLEKFKGEWAGASGQTQFLPSSWYQYAVDYNGDGKKDIWNTVDDALASIANYLKQHGWRGNEPWVMTTTLPEDFDEGLYGFDNQRSLAEWAALGVEIPKQLPLTLQAAILMPEGGPALLAFHNFKVIKAYNNSTFYACSVGYLADKLCAE